MSIEQSRKHGAFDSRYPLIGHKTAPASLWRPGEERLAWQGFLARFYPRSGRHDFDALAAYESYRNDIEARGPDDVRVAPSRGRREEEPWTATETERWESEGGAGTGRLHPMEG
jgi:hypothetical protein